MRPEAIVEYWQLVHQALSPAQTAAFLGRAEVASLTRLDDHAVRTAIDTHAKLTDILSLAENAATVVLGEDLSWWFEGKPCDDDNIPYCHRCKPHPYPDTVVVTRGWGYAFHLSQDCIWLHRGQGSVERRGGDPAPVERVAIQVAFRLGKAPCRVCFPAPGEATA